MQNKIVPLRLTLQPHITQKVQFPLRTPKQAITVITNNIYTGTASCRLNTPTCVIKWACRRRRNRTLVVVAAAVAAAAGRRNRRSRESDNATAAGFCDAAFE